MKAPPTIDHIGVVVADLEQASFAFSRLLGIQPSLIKDMPEVGIRLARFEATNIAIELIQYIGGKSDFGRRIMGDTIGLNHLSIEVADMPNAIKHLTEAGLSLQDGFPRECSVGRVVFFDPDPSTAILFEVTEGHGEKK